MLSEKFSIYKKIEKLMLTKPTMQRTMEAILWMEEKKKNRTNKQKGEMKL